MVEVKPFKLLKKIFKGAVPDEVELGGKYGRLDITLWAPNFASDLGLRSKGIRTTQTNRYIAELLRGQWHGFGASDPFKEIKKQLDTATGTPTQMAVQLYEWTRDEFFISQAHAYIILCDAAFDSDASQIWKEIKDDRKRAALVKTCLAVLLDDFDSRYSRLFIMYLLETYFEEKILKEAQRDTLLNAMAKSKNAKGEEVIAPESKDEETKTLIKKMVGSFRSETKEFNKGTAISLRNRWRQIRTEKDTVKDILRIIDHDETQEEKKREDKIEMKDLEELRKETLPESWHTSGIFLLTHLGSLVGFRDIGSAQKIYDGMKLTLDGRGTIPSTIDRVRKFIVAELKKSDSDPKQLCRDLYLRSITHGDLGEPQAAYILLSHLPQFDDSTKFWEELNVEIGKLNVAKKRSRSIDPEEIDPNEIDTGEVEIAIIAGLVAVIVDGFEGVEGRAFAQTVLKELNDKKGLKPYIPEEKKPLRIISSGDLMRSRFIRRTANRRIEDILSISLKTPSQAIKKPDRSKTAAQLKTATGIVTDKDVAAYQQKRQSVRDKDKAK